MAKARQRSSIRYKFRLDHRAHMPGHLENSFSSPVLPSVIFPSLSLPAGFLSPPTSSTHPYTLFSHQHYNWLCNAYKMNLILSPVLM